MTIPQYGQFIGGDYLPSPADGASIHVENPATEHVIATVPEGGQAEIDQAVQVARRSSEHWAASAPAERATVFDQMVRELKNRREELAQLVTAELGAPIRIARSAHVQLPIAVTSTMADLLRDYSFEEQIGNSLVVQHPVPVVGAITPWNFPLHQVTSKIIPALAAGSTVVLKPSELAPLSSLRLAEIFTAAGLPDGVFNVVTGGPEAGRALVDHDDVDLISFTGSVAAGRAVATAAAGTLKRVTLELGGKSASVILPDADLSTAVKVSVANAFFNSGQACNAWTRMLVPEARLQEVAGLARSAANKHTLGVPTDEGTRVGPLVSAGQRDRVRDYIRTGIREGAEVLVGGAEAPGELGQGYFVRPTIFVGVDPGSTIAQEEIFGPVLSVIGYQDEGDAVDIANGTAYGLGGSVWSEDDDHALRVAKRIRTGQVDINGGPFNPAAPFGGFKRSGYGRELGLHGMAEYLETQSLQLTEAAAAHRG